jgi:hypothetical protein
MGEKMGINAIVTIPPYADYIDEVLNHPLVSGVRLNTVMPTKGSLENLLDSLENKAMKNSKNLWIDLKGRQLRVKTYGVPPFTEIELTHNIELETPAKAYFSGGKEIAKIIKVDGNRLIMDDGPKRVVGPGESVNIPNKTLKIDGYFTKTDLRYIEACKKVGVHDYMLSFVENAYDKESLRKLDEKAVIVEKIESKKGLDYVNNNWDGSTQLMAARGDLYIEVSKPHDIISAVETILDKDKNAIVASRIFDSFGYSLEPSCEDIGDVDNLMRIGYKTLMLGDEVCLRRNSVISALNLLDLMGKKYN